jgi:hypothetical protein
MYSNIKTVLTNGSTGPTGPSASISFDLADGSATGATGGMATIMTISGRNTLTQPSFGNTGLAESQGVQIFTTENTSSSGRRDIASLRISNTNGDFRSGAVIQTVRQRPNNGAAQLGDTIGAWSSWGTTTQTPPQYREYSRIRTVISNPVSNATVGVDGAVVIAVAENVFSGTPPLKDMLRCDGGYPLTLPGGPTGPYNLSYATMVFNPTGASGPQDITGIKAIGNASFNYGATGQCLISNGPNSAFTWGATNGEITGVVAVGANVTLTGTTPYGKCYYHDGVLNNDWNITLPAAGTLTGGIITFSVNKAADTYGFTFTGTTTEPTALKHYTIIGSPNVYSYRLYDAGVGIGWLVV